MTVKQLLSLVAAGLFAVGMAVVPISPAQAAVTVLDFDYGPSGEPCTFNETTPLREQYAGFGIHFRGPNATDGGAVVNTCGNWGVSPHSGERFIGFAPDGTLSNGGTPIGPETIRFDSLKSVVQIYVSQSGFAVGTAKFTMVARRGGKVVKTASVTTTTSDWARLRISAPRGIGKVTLRASDPDRAWLADDLGLQNK